jgi:hypothetical protein
MFHQGHKVDNKDLVERFAVFFQGKIENLTSNAL